MDLTQIDDLAISKLMAYLGNLDWTYILTLIALSYFVVKDELIAKGKLGKVTWISKLRPAFIAIPEAWRVFIVGVLYGSLLHFIRDYQGKDWIENLFNSLVFAMVFHKLLLNRLMSKLDKYIFPSSQTPKQ